MIVCRGEQVSKHFTKDPVFLDLNFQINSNERIGLVGPNGAGKTTLIRLLAQLDKPDGGAVIHHPEARVALLKQFHDFDPERKLIDELRSAMAHLEQWYRDMIAAGEKLASVTDPIEHAQWAKRYDDLQYRLQHHGGYDFDHRIDEVVEGLGFDEADRERPMRTFSGGQQSRVMLGKLLLGSPDLLLLDEPTNHLDIATTEWLEGYLVKQESAMIIVSHDRYFLDKTVNAIWEMHSGKMTEFSGNYAAYQKQRNERQLAAERVRTKQEEAIAHNVDFVRRNLSGQLAKQAKSREKMIERLQSELVETVADIRGPLFTFGEATRAGDIVVSANDLAKQFDDLVLFKNATFEIERGERVGIIGPNGAGKTTLLKIMLNQEPPTSGTIKLGHGVKVGYLDQNLAKLDLTQTPIEAVRPPHRFGERVEVFRAHLARFGIDATQIEQRLSSMSGGERTRVALARLAAEDVNMLILDEPTNHLDLWAVESLESALKSFDGSILIVSHDRYFLDRTVDRLLIVDLQKVRTYKGNYSAYADKLAEERQAIEAAAEKVRQQQLARQKQQQLASEPAKRKRKFPFRKVSEIELDITQTEELIANTEAQLVTPEVYKDGRRAAELSKEVERAREQLTRLMEHWEEAMELNPPE